jgi:hypothetical protein
LKDLLPRMSEIILATMKGVLSFWHRFFKHFSITIGPTNHRHPQTLLHSWSFLWSICNCLPSNPLYSNTLGGPLDCEDLWWLQNLIASIVIGDIEGWASTCIV